MQRYTEERIGKRQRNHTVAVTAGDKTHQASTEVVCVCVKVFSSNMLECFAFLWSLIFRQWIICPCEREWRGGWIMTHHPGEKRGSVVNM